jgi:glycine hydroxymethyltransferase
MSKNKDKEIIKLINLERKRRSEGLEMIPSENHASKDVLEVLSSILNDKYAEGYPGKRYYGGCEIVDRVETICQERAKKLFDVPYANVQPYSGSPANHAVYFAVLKPGEKVMGMDLSVGGHLTHGFKVNFSGKYYKSCPYGVSLKDHKIDYKDLEFKVKKEKPKLIWAGTTAYPRIIDWAKFKKIADSVNAYLAADIAHISGLVVSGSHPSPVPYVDIVTTTTHKTLRGPRGGIVMVTKSGIEKDKNLPSKIDRSVFPGLQGGPHENQIAGIAVALREASTKEYKEYGCQVVKNAKALSLELINNNFNLVTGGTDNHLMVVDLRNKKTSGQQAEDLLEKSGITVNKNTIPFDSAPPFSPSGIRLGTPAITTRGMKEKEMKLIASWISEVIDNKDKKTCLKIKAKVKDLCKYFPIP